MTHCWDTAGNAVPRDLIVMKWNIVDQSKKTFATYYFFELLSEYILYTPILSTMKYYEFLWNTVINFVAKVVPASAGLGTDTILWSSLNENKQFIFYHLPQHRLNLV